MRCLPCGTEMRFVRAVQYQAIVKTHELHTFECPNCKRTERRRVSAHNIGSLQTERMQLPPTTLPLLTADMEQTLALARNGWTCMVGMFRQGISSIPVLMEKVLVAARKAWVQTVAFRSSASGGAPNPADLPVETSTKYDMVSSLRIAAALRSIVIPKLLVLAERVISSPRRDNILVGSAFTLIVVALFNIIAQDRNLAAEPTGESRAGQASAQASSAAKAPVAESPFSPTADPASVTEQKVVQPDPLASLDPADRAIAEKIRDLLAVKSGRTFASKKEREAVEAFYQKRNLAPIWLEKGAESARAKSVIARIRNAEADGLELRDYNLPNFVGLATDALAEADIKLTHTVLTFARHLQAGRFPYHFVSRNIQLPQAPPEPSEVLSRISDAVDAGKALDEFGPQQEPYRKLRAALAQLRAKPGAAATAIAEGPVLSYSRKTQMEDPRVPLLRERLKIAGGASDRRYDATVMDAVKKYQEANHLPATGSLDARTVRELNSSTRDSQIDTIIANMERWRWYPRDLGDAHVLVNQPDFTLKVMHNGVQVWSTRVVIGKTSMPTPLLSGTFSSASTRSRVNLLLYGGVETICTSDDHFNSAVDANNCPNLEQPPSLLCRTCRLVLIGIMSLR
jgi:peptidoglycan hydrolase-like protein with peptidoglycan-binding domain